MSKGGTVEVKEKDTGLEKFLLKLKQIKHSYIRVGVLSDEGAGAESREGGVTNAELAAIHEFGTTDGRIPERSFMRSTLTANHNAYATRCTQYMQAVLEDKMEIMKALNLLGLEIANDMKKTVTMIGVEPPNAPSTIAKKLGLKGYVMRGKISNALDDLTAFGARDAWAPVQQGKGGKVRASREGKSLVSKFSRAVNAYQKAGGRVRPLIDTGRMIGALTWVAVLSDGTKQKGA